MRGGQRLRRAEDVDHSSGEYVTNPCAHCHFSLPPVRTALPSKFSARPQHVQSFDRLLTFLLYWSGEQFVSALPCTCLFPLYASVSGSRACYNARKKTQFATYRIFMSARAQKCSLGECCMHMKSCEHRVASTGMLHVACMRCKGSLYHVSQNYSTKQSLCLLCYFTCLV